jgi:hypothetical protein
VFSLNDQDILFAIKENVVLRPSKTEDPSTESNPYRFGFSTDNPHRYHRQEEAFPHLHTEDRAKLERLRSARLIQGDQKITSRHADVSTRLKDS